MSVFLYSHFNLYVNTSAEYSKYIFEWPVMYFFNHVMQIRRMGGVCGSVYSSSQTISEVLF
jgi:hypothetical protein